MRAGWRKDPRGAGLAGGGLEEGPGEGLVWGWAREKTREGRDLREAGWRRGQGGAGPVGAGGACSSLFSRSGHRPRTIGPSAGLPSRPSALGPAAPPPRQLSPRPARGCRGPGVRVTVPSPSFRPLRRPRGARSSPAPTPTTSFLGAACRAAARPPSP